MNMENPRTAKILLGIHSLVNQPTFSDIKLICKNQEELFGHKYFEKQLNTSKSSGILDLSQFEKSAVLVVLKFIYTGQFTSEVDIDTVGDLLELSHILELDDLLNITVNLVENKLNIQRSVDLFVLSSRNAREHGSSYGWVKLRDMCMSYIRNHLTETIKEAPESLLKLDRKSMNAIADAAGQVRMKPREIQDVYDVVLQWAENEYGVNSATELIKGLSETSYDELEALEAAPFVFRIEDVVKVSGMVESDAFEAGGFKWKLQFRRKEHDDDQNYKLHLIPHEWNDQYRADWQCNVSCRIEIVNRDDSHKNVVVQFRKNFSRYNFHGRLPFGYSRFASISKVEGPLGFLGKDGSLELHVNIKTSSLSSMSALYLVTTFEDQLSCEDYLELPRAVFKRIISSDYLNVKEEIQVLNAVLKWLDFNANSSSSHSENLIEQVRLSQIPIPDLLDAAKRLPFLRRSYTFREMLNWILHGRSLHKPRYAYPARTPTDRISSVVDWLLKAPTGSEDNGASVKAVDAKSAFGQKMKDSAIIRPMEPVPIA